MALVLYWYDSCCFAIVAIAIAGSLWVILNKEGSRCPNDWTKCDYESLLIVDNAGSCDGGPKLVALSRIGHVGNAQPWMSCWKGVHPVWLLGLRFVSFVVSVGLLSWDFWCYDSSILVYYTEWTFTLVIIYFAIGTVISAYGCWINSEQVVTEDEEANGFLRREFQANVHATLTFTDKSAVSWQSHKVKEMNDMSAGKWGYAMQVIYQTSAGAVMLTDVVFWGLLVPILASKDFPVDLLMGCTHSLNAIFLLGDTALNSLPFPWFRMAYFVLWSCTYVIFQWVLHACGFTWWPYPFLELSTPWAPAWYIAMAAVHIPCYLFYWLIVKAKHTFFPKWFPSAYIRSY